MGRAVICSAYVNPALVPLMPALLGNRPPARVDQEVRDAVHPSLRRRWSSSTSTTSRELHRRLASSREPFPARTEAASETVRPGSERGRARRRRRRGDQLSPPRSANAGDMRVTPRVGAWRSRHRSAAIWYAIACRNAWVQSYIFSSIAVTASPFEPSKSARRRRIGTSTLTSNPHAEAMPRPVHADRPRDGTA